MTGPLFRTRQADGDTAPAPLPKYPSRKFGKKRGRYTLDIFDCIVYNKLLCCGRSAVDREAPLPGRKMR